MRQQQNVPAYRLRLLGAYDETSGNPIEGARVIDVGGGMSSTTSREGILALVFLPEGTSLVRLQKAGYETQTLTVAISPSDTTPITLLMHRVTELPTVVTTAAATPTVSSTLRHFEEHKKSGIGYFIDDSTLRKHEDMQLADLLRSRAPNATFAHKQGGTYLLQSGRCLNGGPPQVYIDGIAISPTPLPTNGSSARPGKSATPFAPQASAGTDVTPFNLSDFQISDYAGIEWYPDATLLPLEYSHLTTRCGALILWTRQ